MFERFTERARQVVVLAQDEARALKHNYIGTEHLLLGLLREEEGLAARALEDLDVSIEEVRAQVARIIGEGDELTSGQIPFTPAAKRVLELSLRESLSLGHNYIGTEHILLGLARENDGVAARILLDFGVDAENLRNEVIRMLSGPGRATRAEAEPEPSPSPPKSLPLAPEFSAEIERLQNEKERAIEAQEFDRAASLRDRERRLKQAARDLQAVWEGTLPTSSDPPGLPAQAAYTASFGRMPRGVADYEPSRLRGWRFLLDGPSVVAGAVLGTAIAGAGVALGWLIWG